MIGWILDMAFLLSTGWAIYLLISLRKERKETQRLEQALKDRPIGRVTSAEITKDGLLVTGQIFDAAVWDKMTGDVEGISIGYSPDHPTPPDTVPLIHTLPDDKEVDLSFPTTHPEE